MNRYEESPYIKFINKKRLPADTKPWRTKPENNENFKKHAEKVKFL
jgi:hypothetical protein